MFEKIKQTIQESKTLQFIFMFVAGVFIGAVFYPTKRIVEKSREEYQTQLDIVNKQHSEDIQTITSAYNKQIDSLTTKYEASQKTVTTLNVKVKDLTSKVKTSFYKIVKPDGTIEIKKLSESDTSESSRVEEQAKMEFQKFMEETKKQLITESQRQIEELSKKLEQEQQARQKESGSSEHEKEVTINAKRFGLEAGILTSGNFYSHATADIIGPIFIGGHLEVNKTLTPGQAGFGVGIRF